MGGWGGKCDQCISDGWHHRNSVDGDGEHGVWSVGWLVGSGVGVHIDGET